MVAFWRLEEFPRSIYHLSLALLIGVPLGIWTAHSDRAERLMRGFLDTAQVVPAFVYLIPITVLFGIKGVSAYADHALVLGMELELGLHTLVSLPLVLGMMASLLLDIRTF